MRIFTKPPAARGCRGPTRLHYRTPGARFPAGQRLAKLLPPDKRHGTGRVLSAVCLLCGRGQEIEPDKRHGTGRVLSAVCLLCGRGQEIEVSGRSDEPGGVVAGLGWRRGAPGVLEAETA